MLHNMAIVALNKDTMYLLLNVMTEEKLHGLDNLPWKCANELLKEVVSLEFKELLPEND